MSSDVTNTNKPAAHPPQGGGSPGGAWKAKSKKIPAKYVPEIRTDAKHKRKDPCRTGLRSMRKMRLRSEHRRTSHCLSRSNPGLLRIHPSVLARPGGRGLSTMPSTSTSPQPIGRAWHQAEAGPLTESSGPLSESSGPLTESSGSASKANDPTVLGLHASVGLLRG